MKHKPSEHIFERTNKLGQLSFNIGVFFLATALPISGIFFIFSIFISFYETKFNLLSDKWNLSIVFIGGLFLINTLKINISSLESYPYINKIVSSLDLFNWIPLFILFISCQYYLRNEFQRELFSKYFISGTIPVLISCILQYQFKIYGPFKTFYGLIVIFNKKLGIGDGVSGLFSNPNYTGLWLSISLPILFLLVFKYKKFNLKKLSLFIILIFLIYVIFLTLSRNSILGLISSLLLIFGLKKFLTFVFFIFLIYLFYISIFSFLDIKSLNLIGEYQIQNFIGKFGIADISNILEITRIKIWINTFRLIIQKPIFGFGASTFPIVFYNFTNSEMQHSHNMPLQLAYDYGLPLSILLTSFITFLFIKSFINIFQLKNFNRTFLSNKCWLAACLVAILNHISDITYYDGKISILIWILFAGLKCIIDETNKFKNISQLRQSINQYYF